MVDAENLLDTEDVEGFMFRKHFFVQDIYI